MSTYRNYIPVFGKSKFIFSVFYILSIKRNRFRFLPCRLFAWPFYFIKFPLIFQNTCSILIQEHVFGSGNLERVILHSDCNSFYASVECLHRPEIREKPVAVGGDVEQRHSIILTKNQIAKRYHVKTGEALWQAKQKCPDLALCRQTMSFTCVSHKWPAGFTGTIPISSNRSVWMRPGWRVHGFPRPISFWKITPGCAASRNPEDSVHY